MIGPAGHVQLGVNAQLGINVRNGIILFLMFSVHRAFERMSYVFLHDVI